MGRTGAAILILVGLLIAAGFLYAVLDSMVRSSVKASQPAFSVLCTDALARRQHAEAGYASAATSTQRRNAQYMLEGARADIRQHCPAGTVR